MAELVPLLSAEENNETSWYTAGAAGIASGVLKVPEGIFSLAAELIDLGLGTETAESIENFFDDIIYSLHIWPHFKVKGECCRCHHSQ